MLGTGYPLVAAVLVAAVAWTVWLTRAVVRGGSADTGGAELPGVRPGEVEREQDVLTAYHYRTSSRFGEYVQLRVRAGMLEVSGRRLDPGTYTFFIGLQTLLMALVPVALLSAAVLGRWPLVLAAPVLLLAYAFASSAMAGGLWEGPGIAACQEPGTLPRIAVPLGAISDVRIGRGWARRRLGWVIWPFVRPIDALAEGHAVSFEGPDPVTGRRVVFALHFYTPAEADAFAGRLRAVDGA